MKPDSGKRPLRFLAAAIEIADEEHRFLCVRETVRDFD